MIKQVFSRCFEVLFIIAMGLVTILAITGTKRNIEWQNQLFVTSVMVVAMLILYLLLQKIKSFLASRRKVLFVAFLALWGVALYVFCYVFKNEPAHDYATVMQAVDAFLNGAEVDWSYFALFKNNFLLLVILMAINKVAFLIGLQDGFGLMLLFSVLLVVWAGFCIFKLLEASGCAVESCFMGLFLFAGFMPLWGGTYNLYTDCVSLCFGVWACYLLSRAKEGKHKWLYFMAAGFVWGIGYGVKTTVAVSLVAVLLVMLLTISFRKMWKIIAGVAVGFLIATVAIEAVWEQFPCAKMEEEYAAPFSYWFAIGLCGDGSDPYNVDFAVECLETPGMEGKKQVAKEHIKENLHELWNPEHLILKARYNFASGHMGLPDFNRYNVNIMYEIFNDYGIYGGYAIMYSSGYLYAIYVFGIMGSMIALIKDFRKEKVSTMGILSRLTIFGLVLFLMLFEANNRQLYNHMPWFALMGASGCEQVGHLLGQKVLKCRKKAE